VWPAGVAAVVSPVKVTLTPAKDGEETDEDVNLVRAAEEVASRLGCLALWARELLGELREEADGED
jgi:hypothetical protein